MGGKKKSKKAPAPGDAVAAYQAYVGTFLGDSPGDTEPRLVVARLVEEAAALKPSGGAYYLAVRSLCSGAPCPTEHCLCCEHGLNTPRTRCG